MKFMKLTTFKVKYYNVVERWVKAANTRVARSDVFLHLRWSELDNEPGQNRSKICRANANRRVGKPIRQADVHHRCANAVFLWL